MSVDCSSAPLRELRKFRKLQTVNADAPAKVLGAAIKVTGLYDVPLCPNWVVSVESTVNISHMLGFLIWRSMTVDPEACPVGCVVDNLETVFGSLAGFFYP